jgi:hypothetical protein
MTHPFSRGKEQSIESFALFVMPPRLAVWQPQKDLDEVSPLQQALASPLIFLRSHRIVIINASPTMKQVIMISVMIVPPG